MLTTIIAAVDGSEPARRALALAGDLAGRYAARLLIVHVVSHDPMPGELKDLTVSPAGPVMGLAETPEPDALSEAEEPVLRAVAGERLLSEALELARVQGAAQVDTLLLSGDPATLLLERIAQEQPELVVMGAKGLGALKGLLLGSVSQKVCQLAPCACLTVR